MSPTTKNPIIRYSPKPLQAYQASHKDQKYGPATSSLLAGSPEAWNLAYLSHDYDALLQPADPYFTTNVRRTVQSRLDGSGPDLAGSMPASLLIQAMLRLPAPRFVYLIHKHEHLKTLPMYLAYGDAWLQTMERRAMTISCDDTPVPPINDMQDALALISRF